EERVQHAPRRAKFDPSFETRPAGAPQDEAIANTICARGRSALSDVGLQPSGLVGESLLRLFCESARNLWMRMAQVKEQARWYRGDAPDVAGAPSGLQWRRLEESRMDADLVADEGDDGSLKGDRIIAAIKASGVEFILSVPDIVTSGGLLRPIARDPHFR